MQKWFNLSGIVILVLSLGAQNPCVSSFQSAQQAYQAFRKDRTKTKYHQNWEKQARSFERIALNYPECEKADDAWFMLGKLWQDCYQLSRNSQDQQKAISAFSELVKRYPKSNLADDALLAQAEIHLARAEKGLAQEKLSQIIRQYPNGDCAPKAKNYLAKLGVSDSEQIFSSHSSGENLSYVPSRAPVRSNDAIAQLLEKSATGSGSQETPLAELLQIRYWSAPSYTRVVVDLSQKVEVSQPRMLQPDPSLGTPPRIYFDLYKTKLSTEFRANFEYKDNCYELPIGDGLLRRARAGQYSPEVVRVVLDMQSISDFQTLFLPGENGRWRVVIDTFGEKNTKSGPPQPPPPTLEPKPAPIPGLTSAPSPAPAPEPQPSLPSKTKTKPAPLVVVIDAGHGGKDPGAIGKNQTQEKTIALSIARHLEGEIIKRISDARVILTRRDDRFLSLEERTAKANAIEPELSPDQPALFISIHCNASKDRSAYGIETYYLDNTTDRAALKLAAVENFVSEEVMEHYSSEVNKILADLTTTSKVSYSIPLAHSIQEHLIQELSRDYSEVKNLGVKKAPFWVLTGARLPCVLIEAGFISNPTEEKRLNSTNYQKAIARGIAKGIEDWAKNPKSVLIP